MEMPPKIHLDTAYSAINYRQQITFHFRANDAVGENVTILEGESVYETRSCGISTTINLLFFMSLLESSFVLFIIWMLC